MVNILPLATKYGAKNFIVWKNGCSIDETEMFAAGSGLIVLLALMMSISDSFYSQGLILIFLKPNYCISVKQLNFGADI